MEPSPHAASTWFSLISDHARSYNASFVSNLRGVVSGGRECFYQGGVKEKEKETGEDLRLLYLDASSRQAERKQTAIAHDAEVGSRGDSHSIVVVGRVLDGIWVEAPCAELKHRSHVE